MCSVALARAVFPLSFTFYYYSMIAGTIKLTTIA
jgi:hypothetical protein